MGRHTKALIQVLVHGNHVEFKVQRAQYKCNNKIAQEEA